MGSVYGGKEGEVGLGRRKERIDVIIKDLGGKIRHHSFIHYGRDIMMCALGEVC